MLNFLFNTFMSAIRLIVVVVIAYQSFMCIASFLNGFNTVECILRILISAIVLTGYNYFYEHVESYLGEDEQE